MTLDEIRRFVTGIDPDAGHYESAYQGDSAYTVWREYNTMDMMADNEHQGAQKFQIDRFTKDEFDQTAIDLEAALEADPRIAYRHLTDYERDTRYIHHIYECEGI